MIQKSYRSAKTGRFVTAKFAKKHKATTYLQKIKKKTDDGIIRKPRFAKLYPKITDDSFNEG